MCDTHLPSTYFLHTHPYLKIQQKSGIGVILGVEVIMQFLEHRILGMWNIDQNSLVSRGWPCAASYT